MSYTNIDLPTDYFNTTAYTGNGSAGRNLTTGTFQPDWVWIKSRSDTDDHRLIDAVRGATIHFESNNTAQEQTSSNVTAFTSTGITLSSNGAVNANAETYVVWSWLGANTTVSNTQGTRTSTVSANTTSGFSIVSYTGNQVAGATVGHGLGVKPALMIVKLRSGDVAEPMVYHKSLGATKAFKLNTSDAPITNTTIWNDTEPTTTVFSVGTSNNVNHIYPLIAYCFAEIKGYSKFGSYTGNGSADGTFVYTGFKPAFLIVKRYNDAGYDWLLYDNKRQVEFNVVDDFLKPNTNDAETTGNANQSLDFLSNGVKFRGSGASSNGSGASYIYMAFAENPFVSSKGIPTTAR
jgi:hypothetical protein